MSDVGYSLWEEDALSHSLGLNYPASSSQEEDVTVTDPLIRKRIMQQSHISKQRHGTQHSPSTTHWVELAS